MKRFLAVLVVAGVAVGGAGIAWAHPSGEGRGPRREARLACLREAREANPDAERAELKAAVKSCLEAKGITPPQLTPEQQARWDKFRACVEKARAEHPDADRHAVRHAVRECMKGS